MKALLKRKRKSATTRTAFLTLLILITAFSCNSPECYVAQKHANSKPKLIICTINESENHYCHETYYDTGVLESKFCTKKGKLLGETVFYYESGHLKSKGTYKDDKKEGILTTYYENEQVESKCNYKDDERDGERFGYFKDGRPYYYYTYRNGIYVFFKKYLYESDSIFIEEVFKPIVEIEKDTLASEDKYLKFSVELSLPDSLMNEKELYFAYQMIPISFKDSIIDDPRYRFRIIPREKKTINLLLTEDGIQKFYYHVFQKDKNLIMNPTEHIITVQSKPEN